jgi:hypothetical protein
MENLIIFLKNCVWEDGDISQVIGFQNKWIMENVYDKINGRGRGSFYTLPVKCPPLESAEAIPL